MRHQRRWLVLAAVLFLGCPPDGDDDAADDNAADDDTEADDDAGDDDTVNQPPTAPDVDISPDPATVHDDLVCSVSQDSTDPEGDPVTYRFEWFESGQPTGFEDEPVPASATALLASWACHVTPNDGTQDGPPGIAMTAIGPTSPSGSLLEITLHAMGGDNGGPATTTLTHVMVDADCELLCSVQFEFEGDYTFGTSQGDDFWEPTDEIVTWTSGLETANDCPPQWQTYKGDLVDSFRWYLHPLTMVSCAQVAVDLALAATFIGDDPLDYGNGTLGDYCVSTGPLLQADLGSGPIEAVWLIPGTAGSLDGLGNYAYFPPPDTTHVAVWMIAGAVMATSSNTAEPIAGLDGDYVFHRFWDWWSGGC